MSPSTTFILPSLPNFSSSLEVAVEMADQLDFKESAPFPVPEAHQLSTEHVSVATETPDRKIDDGKDEKKARAKAKLKEKKRVMNELDREEKETLAQMDTAVIADYIAALVKQKNSDLSGIELQDNTVPESSIKDTSESFSERNTQTIGPFFQKYGLHKKGKAKDLVLVLTMSAIRVCNVVRALRSTNKGGALKLIKQNKPDYDRRCLKSPAHLAVSTPGRIEKLTELKFLDLKRIKRIVVDSSFLDEKQRTVWNIDGTVELISKLVHENDAEVYLF